ncbi:MAG: hypothetical protein NVS3B26_21500 [Mycobacteriales bacterium]
MGSLKEMVSEACARIAARGLTVALVAAGVLLLPPASGTLPVAPQLSPGIGHQVTRALGGGALLIQHQRVPTNTPTLLASRAAAVDALPFQGLTVTLPTLSDTTFSSSPADAATYRTALAPMPYLRRVCHNFVLLHMDRADLDLRDATTWTTVLANIRALGAAARQHQGFVGVFLDTEYYGPGQGPWAPSRRRGRSSLDDALFLQRGQELVAALGSSWPGADLLTTFGPWIGSPDTAHVGLRGLGYADVSSINRLMGSFLVGVAVDSVSSRVHYVDGGELYQLRTAAQFRQAYTWRKARIAARLPAPVPPWIPATWPSLVSVAFGVYDADVTQVGFPDLPTATFLSAVAAALIHTDRYVWTYSDRYDWYSPDHGPPADLVQGLRRLTTRGPAGCPG